MVECYDEETKALVERGINPIDFPGLKPRIHGVSFSESRQETSMLKNLSIAPEWCNIVVVHGEVTAAGTESVYHPITKQDIASSGADYIALGHIHRRSEPQRCRDTWYAYPGIPEGRGFDETGDCGYYEGEAEKGSVNLRWVSCCRRRFWVCSSIRTSSSFSPPLACRFRLPSAAC